MPDVRAQPVLVDIHALQPRALRGEHVMRHAVARVLDNHAVAWLEQQAGAQAQRLLGAIDDQQLVRLAGDPSCARQIGMQRPPKTGVAARVAVGQLVGRSRSTRRDALLPDWLFPSCHGRSILA